MSPLKSAMDSIYSSCSMDAAVVMPGGPEFTVVDGLCPHIAQLIPSSRNALGRLSAQTNPIAAVGALLRTQQAVTRLQLVAHGRPGAIHLGGRWVTSADLTANAAELASWGLERIELWSCRAAQDAGFVALLSELSGAEVWASCERLGRSGEASHWQLQRCGARMESPAPSPIAPFHTQALQAWPHHLDAAMDTQLNLFNLSNTAEASPELLAALQLAERQLATHLEGDDALQKLFASFNGGNSEANGAWQKQAQDFLTALQAGELSMRLELRSSAELLGAYGAFAAAGPDGQPVIYLNEAWLPHLSDADLTRLILEESGHWIDSQINGTNDTPGDEGEAFAAEVMGLSLSQIQLRAIAAENDSRKLLIDGIEISVELSAGSTMVLEFGPNGGPTVSGTTTAPQTFQFQLNTDNPTGNTFAPYNSLSATYSFSSSALVFGGRGGDDVGGNVAPPPAWQNGLYSTMSGGAGAPQNAYFTSAASDPKTGIDVGANYIANIFIDANYLSGAPINSRNYVADWTVTFNRPVSNPTLHLQGMGGG